MQSKWLDYLQEHNLPLYADAVVELRELGKEGSGALCSLRTELAELKAELEVKKAQLVILMRPLP